MKSKISFKVNGDFYELEVEPHRRLLQVLREDLELTGTKEGCGEGECGSCTVIVNGKAVCSCLMLAHDADGSEVVTIEGLASGDKLHPIQQAFIDRGAVQCGFCTPGMIIAAKALLDSNPRPTEEDARQAIRGNLCRCTGYVKIVQAILSVPERRFQEIDE